MSTIEMSTAPRDGTFVMLHRSKARKGVALVIKGCWCLSRRSWSGGAWRTAPGRRALGQDKDFVGWSAIEETQA